MYSVWWTHEARQDLANLWIKADSPDRKRITNAAHQAEEAFKRNPDTLGESREDDYRIHFQPPLAIVYQVDKLNMEVAVVQVWRY